MRRSQPHRLRDRRQRQDFDPLRKLDHQQQRICRRGSRFRDVVPERGVRTRAACRSPRQTMNSSWLPCGPPQLARSLRHPSPVRKIAPGQGRQVREIHRDAPRWAPKAQPPSICARSAKASRCVVVSLSKAKGVVPCSIFKRCLAEERSADGAGKDAASSPSRSGAWPIEPQVAANTRT